MSEAAEVRMTASGNVYIDPNIPLPPHRRVGLVDLEELRGWLVPRLQQKHPKANHGLVYAWLRGALFSNMVLFVRTEHAVGMVEIVQEPLEIQPVALERFVLAMEGFAEEAAALYVPMADWAEGHNASRFDLERHTDVARGDIRGMLGKLEKKEFFFLKLRGD